MADYTRAVDEAVQANDTAVTTRQYGFKDWTTDLPSNLDDPITDNQPDLLNDPNQPPNDNPPTQGDNTRISHLLTLRLIAQYCASQIGSDAKDAGTLRDILDKTSTEAFWLRLAERGADPTPVADRAFLYAKDDGGVTKPYMIWSDGTVTEIGAGGGGGGGTGSQEDNNYFSYFYANGTWETGSNFTTGVRLFFLETGTVTGIRFWCQTADAHTFRGKLWNSTSELASGTVATSGQGYYELSFTTPYEITGDLVGNPYIYISLYDITGPGQYSANTGDPPGGPLRKVGKGWAAYDGIPHNYRSGDDSAPPTSTAGVGRYPMDPIFEREVAGYTFPTRGECYVSSSSGTTISTPGTYVKLAGTYSDGDLESFTHSAGTLTYTGSLTKPFTVRASVSIVADSTDTYSIRLAKNGTSVAKTEIEEYVISTDGSHTVAVSGFIELATSDTVEIQVTDASVAGAVLTGNKATLVAVE